MGFDQKDWLQYAFELYAKAKDMGLMNNWGQEDLNSLREVADKFNNFTGTGSGQPSKGEQIQKEAVSQEEEMEGGSFWQQESGPSPGSPFPRDAKKNSFAPPISIYETAREVNVDAILPGIASRDDLNIVLSQEAMELSGTRATAGLFGGKKTNENFYKIIRLPAPVDPSGATASYRKGFLYIRAPKKNHPSPIKLTVQFE